LKRGLEFQTGRAVLSGKTAWDRMSLRSKSAAGFLAISLLAVLFVAPLSCARNPGYKILLITVDTTRADHLSCYGSQTTTTPAMDKIARQGVLFSNAYSHLPMTLPAHTSMLSGTYPLYHSVVDNGEYRVPDQLQMLPEILKPQGYATAAFISAAVLKKVFNINQGFDHWDEQDINPQHGQVALVAERKADVTTDAVLKWLRENHRKKWFLWVHYYDPHASYEPPQPFKELYESDPYSGEIAFMDSQIGRLMNFLDDKGLADKTIVIVIGDHGESLGQHGEMTHSVFIYQATQHVPLIIRAPGTKDRGTRIITPAGQVDVMPTVLDFLGLKPPAEVQGRSLKGLVMGEEKDAGDAAVFMESHFPYLHFGWSDLYGLATAQYEYIQAPKPELYDLAQDQGELENIAGKNPKLVKELDFRLEQIKNSSRPRFEDEVKQGVSLDDQTRRQLDALGYAAGARPVDPERAKHKNPKDFADLLSTLNSMQGNRVAGKYQSLLEQAGKVLKRDPENVAATRMKADALFGQGKYRQAIHFLQNAIAKNGDNPDYYHTIGMSCLRLDRFDQAQKAFEKALELDPKKKMIRYYLARILLKNAQVIKALKIIDDADMRDMPMGHLFMAEYYAEIPGLAGQAEEEFQTAAKMAPESGLIRREYGIYLLKTNRPQKALELFEEAEKLDPSFKADTALQDFKKRAGESISK